MPGELRRIVQPDVRVASLEPAEKKGLLLARERLSLPVVLGVVVAIPSVGPDDLEMRLFDAHLLAQLARQRRLGILALVDAALWKLPGFRDSAALRDEDLAVFGLQNGGYVRTISAHGFQLDSYSLMASHLTTINEGVRHLLHALTRPPAVFALAALVALALVWLGWRTALAWKPEAMVTSRHEKLVSRIAAKKFGKCAPLLSGSYLDQWGWSKDDAMLAIRDIGGQFFVLEITMQDFTVAAEGKTARSSARLRLRGSGSAAAPLIVGEANRIKSPFVFHWRKENWRPWSWRIHRIENEGTPDFQGYRPGDFGAAMKNPGALTP